MSELPEWCTEGATVAATNGMEAIAVKVLSVEADGVTVDDRGLEKRYGLRSDGALALPDWNWDWHLRPIEDDEVQRIMASQERRRHITAVRRYVDAWQIDNDLDAARAIADVLVESGVIASYEPAEAPDA